MNYNSLQVSFRQRAFYGLQYTANYTYSKAMTNSTGFYGVPNVTVTSGVLRRTCITCIRSTDPRDRMCGIALNFNLVYDLPVGRGRSFGGGLPLFVDEVIGGWKVGVTGIAYSGFPVNISAQNNLDGERQLAASKPLSAAQDRQSQHQ